MLDTNSFELSAQSFKCTDRARSKNIKNSLISYYRSNLWRIRFQNDLEQLWMEYEAELLQLPASSEFARDRVDLSNGFYCKSCTIFSGGIDSISNRLNPEYAGCPCQLVHCPWVPIPICFSSYWSLYTKINDKRQAQNHRSCRANVSRNDFIRRFTPKNRNDLLGKC